MDAATERLQEALRAVTPPQEVRFSGLTPEMRTAYALAAQQSARLEQHISLQSQVAHSVSHRPRITISDFKGRRCGGPRPPFKPWAKRPSHPR